MSTTLVVGGYVFRKDVTLIDATSLHRPDTAWGVIDPAGHLHQWYVHTPDRGVIVAEKYHPSLRLLTPTLVWVEDGEEYFEDDDEPHAVGHWECALCQHHVDRSYTADREQVLMPGIVSLSVDGVSVSPEQFSQLFDAAMERHRKGAV